MIAHISVKKLKRLVIAELSDTEIETYVKQVAAKFKKQQYSSTKTQINYRFNIMGTDEDIFIPVRG